MLSGIEHFIVDGTSCYQEMIEDILGLKLAGVPENFGTFVCRQCFPLVQRHGKFKADILNIETKLT